jgi:hypothetical protein
MNDLQQLREWVAKANALAGVVVDAQGVVAEARLRQVLAKDDDRLAERYKAEYVFAKRQYDLALAMLNDATGTEGPEDAATTLLDIRVGCTSVYELYEGWRKALFLIGVLEACGGTGDDGTTLADVDRKARSLEAEYRAALRAACALIPDSDLLRLSL